MSQNAGDFHTPRTQPRIVGGVNVNLSPLCFHVGANYPAVLR